MMKARTFLTLLGAVLVASLLGLAIADSAGYVLIAYKGFRYESTFWVFIALLGAIGGVVWLKLRVWRLLSASGQLINPWSGRHRSRRVQNALERGFEELSAGRWSHALRLLSRAAPLAPLSLPAYLAAAQAAHALGDSTRAQALLSEARERNPRAAVSVALQQARFFIEDHNDLAAREPLADMQKQHPRHPEVLRLLAGVLERLGDWLALGALLPELRRQTLYPAAALDELETRALLGRLRNAAHTPDAQALRQCWQSFDAPQRQRPALIAAYVETMRSHGLAAEAEAETLLREALNRQLDERLLALYGCVQGRDLTRQLAQAERWLHTQNPNATLLLTLGRLSLRNQLWGKARDYFEQSLALERRAETCVELARLLSRLGDEARSQQVLHLGLGLLGRELPSLPLPTVIR